MPLHKIFKIILIKDQTFLQNIKFNSRHLQLNKFPVSLQNLYWNYSFIIKRFLSSLHMSILMLSKNCLIKIDVWLWLVSTSLHIGPVFVSINCKQDWFELLISARLISWQTGYHFTRGCGVGVFNNDYWTELQSGLGLTGPLKLWSVSDMIRTLQAEIIHDK